MAGRVMKTIFDVIGRDSGASATGNRVAASFRRMTGEAQRSQRALTGQNAAFQQTQTAMNAAFKSMAIGGGFLAAGNKLTGMLDQAQGYAADLEYEMATLAGISGASAKDLDRLAAAAQKAGIETQFTPTESIQGLQALAQQGFVAEQQLQSLNSVLMLAGASGGKVSIAESAKLTTQVLKAFGKQADESGLTVDRMVKTTTMSGLAIEELAEGMQNAAAGAISMNIGLEETMGTLGLIKNIIPSASMAGSAFQILTSRMSNPMIQKKIKRTLGIDVIDQATGKYRNFADLMVEMSSKMAGMKEGKRGAFIVETFGARAQKGIAAVFKQLTTGVQTSSGEVLKGKAAFDYFLGAMDEDQVRGFAQAMNDMKLDTLHGQMELLNGSLQTFQIELGKGSAAISKTFVKYGLKVFNAFLEFFSKLPKPVKAAVSGFLKLSGGLMKVIGGFFILKGLMSLLGISFGGIMLTIGKILLLAIPLTLMFTAIGIGAYGLYRMISKNFGQAGDETASMFEKIKLGYRGVVDLISTGALSDAVITDMKKAKFKGVADFIGVFGEWLGKAKQFFKGVVDGFDEGLKRLVGPWRDFKDAIYEAFGSWFQNANKGALSIDQWEAKGKKFGFTLSGFSKTLLEMATGAVKFGRRLAEWASNIDIEDVIDQFQRIAETINDIVDSVRWLMDNNVFTMTANVVDYGTDLLGSGTMARYQKALGRTPDVVSAEELTKYAKASAYHMRKGGGFVDTGVESNWYGYESDVERFVGKRASRLETLRKSGQFQDDTIANLQQSLISSANEAAKERGKGEMKAAREREKHWDAWLNGLEAKLVAALEKSGGMKGLKLKIGEEEFGRLVDQAGKTVEEGNYDSPNMSTATIPTSGGQ